MGVDAVCAYAQAPCCQRMRSSDKPPAHTLMHHAVCTYFDASCRQRMRLGFAAAAFFALPLLPELLLAAAAFTTLGRAVLGLLLTLTSWCCSLSGKPPCACSYSWRLHSSSRRQRMRLGVAAAAFFTPPLLPELLTPAAFATLGRAVLGLLLTPTSWCCSVKKASMGVLLLLLLVPAEFAARRCAFSRAALNVAR